MAEQPLEISPGNRDLPGKTRAARAMKLQAEADNCIALVLNSEVDFAAELIDEAVMLARRARELRQA